MIKKITLTTLTAFSLLLVSAQAEGMKCASGKCMMKQNKMMKKKHSPFLIKHGLPHMTKIVMKSWDDAKLALTPKQKEQLLVVRKETMGSVKRLKPEIVALTKEIVQASRAGTTVAELKSKVEKLALLEAEATVTHLKCIENTKAVLKTEQLQYLKQKRKHFKVQKFMKCNTSKCQKK